MSLDRSTADRDELDAMRQPFVPFSELIGELRGKMLPNDRLDDELRELDEAPRNPFA